MNPPEFNENEQRFINRIKYDEQQIFCICVDVSILYESDDFDDLYEVLSTLKIKN